MMAAKANHEACVRLLSKKGLDIKDNKGIDVLSYATDSTIKVLLQHM